MKYRPKDKLNSTVTLPATYIPHLLGNSPRREDSKTAVVTYLATSISHLPISFLIMCKYKDFYQISQAHKVGIKLRSP